MKITKENLKDLVNEELKNLVKEGDLEEGAYDWFTKSHSDWADVASDIEADAQKPQVTGPGRIEKALDKLLADFRNGLLGIIKPQVAEVRKLRKPKISK